MTHPPLLSGTSGYTQVMTLYLKMMINLYYINKQFISVLKHFYVHQIKMLREIHCIENSYVYAVSAVIQ